MEELDQIQKNIRELEYVLEDKKFENLRLEGTGEETKKLDLTVDSLSLARAQTLYDLTLQEHRKLFIKDELWETYLKEGGVGLNAYTSKLMTAYFVTLPKNKIELYLWFEADRMQNAVLREFYTERDVVLEERRMRVDDRPTGRYSEALNALQYENHPFRNPTIGWSTDISKVTRAQAEKHYQDYYKPANAILVLAGAINSEELMVKVKEYFGSIPAGKKLKLRIKEVDQDSEKRLIHRRNDAKPRIDIAFHVPPVGHPDLYALDVIEGVLNGKSGRLYRRLVEKEKLAISAGVGNYWNKYTSEFGVQVVLRPNVDPKLVESIVWEELNRLKTEAITPRELKKVFNQSYAQSVRALQDPETVASRLAYYEMYGDWQLINKYSDRLARISVAEVQRVAKLYFRNHRATIGMLLPKLVETPINDNGENRQLTNTGEISHEQ